MTFKNQNPEFRINNSTLIIQHFLPALAYCLTAALLAGCQPGNTRNDKKIDHTPIAGTWIAEKGDWQITISKNGKVVSALHPLGQVLVKPNETVSVEMLDGSMSAYTGGDFTLAYNPDNREMDVTIVMEKIHVKFAGDEIMGNTEATMMGFISDDFKTWNADVVEDNDYGPRFPQGEIPNIVPMIFHKVGD